MKLKPTTHDVPVLKESSIDTALKEFHQLTIKHPTQEAAKERIGFLARYSANVSLIVLAGPSGAGKSTLLDRLVESFNDQHAAEMKLNPALVPILYTTAVANGHRAFDFRRLYTDALKALCDPFASARETSRRSDDPRAIYEGESRSAARLREDLEEEIRTRGTLIWIIDEAHHVVRGGKSGHPGDQYDILKSLAQITGVKILLSGTYDLPQFLASSGQLSRRSETVQLRRYHWFDGGDRKTFASIVAAIFKRMPVGAYPDVGSNAEYFYIWSCGCVGIFKDWVGRAFALALQQGANVLTMEHMEAARMSAEQLDNISADVERGEQFMSRFTKTELDQSLRDRILKAPRSAKGPTPQKAPQAKPKQKPGERAIGRDAVGAGNE
jgi:hypothetical protein